MLTAEGLGRTFFGRAVALAQQRPFFLVQKHTKAETVADLLSSIEADGPANPDEQLLAEIIGQADNIEKAQDSISESVTNIWDLMFSWMDKRRAV